MGGEEAVQKTIAERPDLVILDIMMPQMDGLEVLETLRRMPGTAHIPVILLTAKTQPDDIVHGYDIPECVFERHCENQNLPGDDGCWNVHCCLAVPVK
jgi:CheY-like chemotaxis protein